MEGSGHDNPNVNPFGSLAVSSPKELIESSRTGGTFARITVDLDKAMSDRPSVQNEAVAIEHFIRSEYGQTDPPVVHPGFRQRREHRFSYLLSTRRDEQLTDQYAWPLLKYDIRKRKVVARWQNGKTGLFAAQEVQFIADPDADPADPDFETQGILMLLGHDFKTGKASFFVVCPKKMVTLAEYPVPFSSMQVHSNWFAAQM